MLLVYEILRKFDTHGYTVVHNTWNIYCFVIELERSTKNWTRQIQ